MTVRVLTGVTPSGTLHLGNYVGAIRPAIQKSRAEGTESFYFLSDYHALIKTSDRIALKKAVSRLLRLGWPADWIRNACTFIVRVIFLRRWSSIGF